MPSDIHILTHEFRPKRGGAGVVCEKIAETLSFSKRDVTLWAPGYSKEIKGYNPTYNIIPIKGLKGTRNLGCLLSMAKAILKKRRKLGDSHLYLGDPGPIAVFFYLVLFYKKFWKTLTITLHGSEIERYRKNFLSNLLFRNFLRSVDKVHVLSSYNKKKLLDWIPSISEKLVVGYGMRTPCDPLPVLKKDDSTNERIKLLCVGRVHPRKGQAHLLEAVSQLKPDLQEKIEVVFAGQKVKGWYQDKLNSIANHCHAKITFLGELTDDELETIYSKSDIFALTSMPYQSSVEGLGLVYLEAARYAIPLLANRIGGVGDVVIHGKNGYLSSHNSIDELTQNLEVLISNPMIRKQLGDAGRRMVEDCTWEEVCNELFS